MPSAPTLESLGADPDPLLGRVINDRYKIVEAIGNGGMGRVYRAIQAPLDRVVALKVLGAGHDRDPNFYKRFFLEASVTAKLTHQNTITLFDYGRTDDGVFYIAMEYLSGRTLSAAMQAEGPLAQERVIHIAQQICRSLREAHALGIIHRDLKPANVMLMRQEDDHDFVKVLDFGLVKFFSGEASNPDVEITNAGTFMGSPHYIAPEQARNQSPDQRCDIYSLGVLTYHMLTGRVPFTAQNPVDIILKHLHDPPVPPSQLRPDLNIAPALEQILLKCMEKERGDRYQTMDELLMALKVVRAQIVGTSGPMSMPPPYDTFIGPRPSAPGVGQVPPTPPSLLTPSEPMSKHTTGPGPWMPVAARAVTQPPPPPVETPQPVPSVPPAFAEAFPTAPVFVAPVPAAPASAVPPPGAPLSAAPPIAAVAPGARWSTTVIALAVAAVAVSVAVVAVVTRGARSAEPIATPIASPIAPPAAPEHPAAPPPAAPPEAPVPTALTGTTLVRVTSTPSGAEVRDADERAVGTTPFELSVPSNKPLQLSLHADGYKPYTLKQKVSGERLELPVALKRDPRAAAKPDPLLNTKRSSGYKDDPY